MSITPADEESLRRKIARSLLDLFILKMLRDKPKYGYDIIMEFKNKHDAFFSAGTIYPLLYSLEEQGLIEGVWENKGRRRKIYKLTKKGRDILYHCERILTEFLSQ